MRAVLIAPTFLIALLAGCTAPPAGNRITPSVDQTPNLEGTVQARVALTVTALPRPTTPPLNPTTQAPTAIKPAAAATNVPTAAPVAIDQPITLNGSRTMKTEAFRLSGGSYTIDWSATDQPNGVGCFHSGTLKNTDGSVGGQSVADGGPEKGATRTGTTRAYNVKPGMYYVDMISGCTAWSVSISAP